MFTWIRQKLEKKYKLKLGQLVSDIGDGFSRVEEPGIVIEVLPDRYSYRNAVGIKINIDGILVRWLDKKGRTHVYPTCCVTPIEMPEEKAEKLREAAEKFNKPKPVPEDKQIDIPFDTLDDILEIPEDLFEETTQTEGAAPEPEVQEKPSLNKMQEQLREVERIIKERAAEVDEE